MTKKPRKQYTPAEKIKILKKHLVDHIPVSEVCDQFQIAPSMFYKWQQLLFENGSSAFERKKPHRESADQQKIHDLEARLFQKDNVIAEITQEFIAAKKKNGGH